MRYQDIQWPLPAGLCAAAIILVVMLTAGCGPGKIAIAPEVRSMLKEEPEIIAFRYAKFAVFVEIHEAGYPLELLLNKEYMEKVPVKVKEEPLIPLQESFLAAIQAELKLNNIRTLQEPRHHAPGYNFLVDDAGGRKADLNQLQRIFQTGLIFDFDRDLIVFRIYLHPLRDIYRVDLWASARLIRVNEKKILWQGVCNIKITDKSLTRDDFRVPINPLVQKLLDTAVKDCAQEWIAQFMGK